jgi:hypothetical protein
MCTLVNPFALHRVPMELVQHQKLVLVMMVTNLMTVVTCEPICSTTCSNGTCTAPETCFVMMVTNLMTMCTLVNPFALHRMIVPVSMVTL